MRIVLASLAVLLGGCVYEMPLTPAPTRGVEAKLLGDWVSADGRTQLKVRRLDEDDYVVALNGLLFRGRHADLSGIAFADLQDLDGPARKHAYVAWELSEDGERLRWRAVSRKRVPETVTDARTVRSLVERHRDDGSLFEAVQEYARAK